MNQSALNRTVQLSHNIFISANTWNQISYFQRGSWISRSNFLHKSFIKTSSHDQKGGPCHKDPVGANRAESILFYYKEELLAWQTQCIPYMLLDIGRKHSYCRGEHQSSQMLNENKKIIHHWKLKRHLILLFGKGCNSLKEVSVMDHKPTHKSFWCNATYGDADSHSERGKQVKQSLTNGS